MLKQAPMRAGSALGQLPHHRRHDPAAPLAVMVVGVEGEAPHRRTPAHMRAHPAEQVLFGRPRQAVVRHQRVPVGKLRQIVREPWSFGVVEDQVDAAAVYPA
jgi:hypothetical protein